MGWFELKKAGGIAKLEGQKKTAMVIGMSHVEAIQRALTETSSKAIQIVALNTSAKIYDKEKNTLNLSKLTNQNPAHIFVSLGGNFHTIFGLIENPQPFAIASKDGSYSYSTTGRTLIPRAMIKDHFRVRVMRLLQHLEAIKNHFPGSVIHHLCSPPPIFDEDHILKYPGVFRPRIHQGITPAPLRLTLYNVHSEVYQEHCEKLSVNFIAPPSAAIDENGFLGADYVNNDPTHGNAIYGARVLEQIEAILDQQDG